LSIGVSDVRSNPQDQIAHAARVISRSEDCKKVFSAIYKGKKKIKSITELTNLTSLPRIRVLQEAGKLSNNDIAKKTKVNKELAYEKYPFYTQHKNKILQLARNRKALEKFPTKINPKVREISVSISFPKRMIDAIQITIDSIDSFSKAHAIKPAEDNWPIEEKKFKEGLQKILGEEGTFQDWGGETDDLFSTRIIINDERRTAAFGLKGKGTTGRLTPKKMGKHGDQIQRLFRSPADVFFVQYWGQIEESVIEQLKLFAIAKSALEGRKILYGIIDGQDTYRIIKGYPDLFVQLS
jgi:hypothetical protein